MSSSRLFILGATGGIGRALIEQALRRGHLVTAFVRSPEKLGTLRDRVTVRQGNPRSTDELSAALPGHDAVLSALGPPGPGRTTILGDGARSTVRAMQSVGVRRLLIVSAAILFEDAGLLSTIVRRTLLRNVAKDAAEMERVVTSSGLEWTIARPPRLTNGPLTVRYAVADGQLPNDTRLIISRADVAHYLLQEVEANAYVNRIVGVAGLKAGARQRALGVKSPA